MDSARRRLRAYLAYGFAISVVAHVLILPFVFAIRSDVTEEPRPDLIIAHLTPPPKPRPSASPRPTPLPATAPPAARTTAAPRAARPAMHVPRANAQSGGATESASANGRLPSGTGAPATGPQADGSPEPSVVAAVVTPSPQPTPTPLTCARPEQPAATLHAVEPDTPAAASQQGVAGTVEIVVSLDAQSRVVAMRVQSSPSALLNPAAVAAARAARFRTEVRNCVAIAADYIFSVEFSSQ